MTHNLYTIYSPKGEMLEVSKPNFDDLRKHYGWKPQPPVGLTSEKAIAAATVTEETTDGEGTNEGTNEGTAGSDGTGVESPELPDTGNAGTDANVEGGGDEGSSGEVAAVTTSDERAALIAELAEKYDFNADKRWNVAKLTIKRDELAAAAAK